MNSGFTTHPSATLAFVAFLSYGSPAMADDTSHWYLRINGGVSSLANSDTSVDSRPSQSTEFSSGTAFGGAIGTARGPWRIEGEVMYRSNDVDRIGASRATELGDFASLGLGINVLYEKNLFGSDKARSYFGGGLVYLEEIDFDRRIGGREISYSDNDVGLQVILGARYSISPKWDLFSELRYFDAGSVTLAQEQGGDVELTSDYSATSLMLGVGFRF